MIYHGTNMTETILVGPENDLDDICCIDLVKDHDQPIFRVTSCCDTAWVWAFRMDGESNYEMVKHTIIDTMFNCVNMVELMDKLDEIFAEEFNDIVTWEDNECDCENCGGRCCLE